MRSLRFRLLRNLNWVVWGAGRGGKGAGVVRIQKSLCPTSEACARPHPLSVRISPVNQAMKGRIIMGKRRGGMLRALHYLWASTYTTSTTTMTPHAVTNHVKMMGWEVNRRESREKKQRINRGHLGLIQRANPRMGVVMPIVEVDTTQQPAAAPGNSSTIGITSLGRVDTVGRRENRVVGRLHI